MAFRRRAISEAQKETRRTAIMAATMALFATRDFADITMAEVAEAANVVKGTLYLYFPSKEALFLALLGEQLDEWFTAMDVGLPLITPSATAIAQVVALFDATLAERPLLTRLVALHYSILERNVDVATVHAFKLHLRDRLQATGALFERALPFVLAQGGGADALLQCQIIVVGIHSMADATPLVREMSEGPDLAIFAIDFRAYLVRMLRALLWGMAAKATQQGE